MALFGMKIKSRHGPRPGTFNIDGLTDRTAIRQRKQLGYMRSVFSSLSLLFGSCMIYVSLHYIPAFVQPKQVLKFVTGDSAAIEKYNVDRKSKIHQIFGPFIQLFHLDRAYLQAGQKLEITYDFPIGTYADIDIIQCKRFWVIEVFDCQVVSTFNKRIESRSGAESFAFKHAGFYHFRQNVSGIPEGEPYKIVWKRGH